jgi:hypothetical protein
MKNICTILAIMLIACNGKESITNKKTGNEKNNLTIKPVCTPSDTSWNIGGRYYRKILSAECVVHTKIVELDSLLVKDAFVMISREKIDTSAWSDWSVRGVRSIDPNGIRISPSEEQDLRKKEVRSHYKPDDIINVYVFSGRQQCSAQNNIPDAGFYYPIRLRNGKSIVDPWVPDEVEHTDSIFCDFKKKFTNLFQACSDEKLKKMGILDPFSL